MSRTPWHRKLEIKYVDGELIRATTADWCNLRPDGIDYVDFFCIQRAGHSIYYLCEDNIKYDGEIAWVVGGMSLYEHNCEESIIRSTGEVMMRVVTSLPDLRHDQIKIGWWRRGPDTS